MKSGFPRYQMVVGGENHWLIISEAGQLYDCGQVPVSIGGSVLEENGLQREITDEERQRIASIADEYSGDK